MSKPLKKPPKPKDFKLGNHKLVVRLYPNYVLEVCTDDFTYISLKRFKQLRKWLDKVIAYLEANKNE